jgi:hypothetical protein
MRVFQKMLARHKPGFWPVVKGCKEAFGTGLHFLWQQLIT